MPQELLLLCTFKILIWLISDSKSNTLLSMTCKEEIVAKIVSPIRNSIICKLPLKAFLEMTQNAHWLHRILPCRNGDNKAVISSNS